MNARKYKYHLLLLLGALSVGCSSKPLPPTLDSALEVTDVAFAPAQPSIPFRQPDLSELEFVDRAYAVVGIERLRFDPTNPSVTPSHREYLTQCMAILDQAIVWRASGFQALSNGTFTNESWTDAGDNLVESLASLAVPKGLESYAQSLTECLMAYNRFFSQREADGELFDQEDWQDDHDLRASSSAIREAYESLTKFHWRADAYTMNAFYNTHMALDPF